MTNMLHMSTNLMSATCFENTLYECHIAKAFEHPIMSYGILANTRVGVKHSHTQAVFRVATDVAFYSALIFDEVSPYQSIIATMCGFIEELLAKASLCVGSFGYNEESACIFIYTMY